MLEIKPFFIQLEESRLSYSIPFDSLDNHIVYGRLKSNENDYIVNRAYTEVIPKSDYNYSDGNIIFSNKPCILYPYDSIKIVEIQDYNNREIHFTGNGSITAGNLNREFDEHSTHIQLIEKLLKNRVFIDNESFNNQIELPRLLEDTFWVFKDKAIVAYKLQYLKDEYNHLGNELENKYNTLSTKLLNEYKEYLRHIYNSIDEQSKFIFNYYSEQMIIRYTELIENIEDKITHVLENIGQQRVTITIEEEGTVVTVPESFYLSTRANIFVNGILKTFDIDYTITKKNIIFTLALPIHTKVEIIDNLPPTYIEELNNEFETLAKNVFKKLHKFIEDNKENLKGETGPQGAPGKNGANLEFDWCGTSLGVRVEGQEQYTYVNLQGKQGIPGVQGEKGEKGENGDKVLTANIDGSFALKIASNGHLYMLYNQNGSPPDLFIDERGHLIQRFTEVIENE